jgi:hypothetical protein
LEDNINMDLQEVGWGRELDRSSAGYGCPYPALVNAAMNLQVT